MFFNYPPKSVVEMHETLAQTWIDSNVAGQANDDADVNFIHAAVVKSIEETDNSISDLPEDFPAREFLIEADILNIEAVKEIEDLTSIKGIGKATKEQILSYLSK